MYNSGMSLLILRPNYERDSRLEVTVRLGSFFFKNYIENCNNAVSTFLLL